MTENYLSWQLLPELSARASSRWRSVHLTRYSESRVERQAASTQNQENYLSYQIEGTSIENLSSRASEAASINRLTAELMSSLSPLAASSRS
jgi:hypothetical protein